MAVRIYSLAKELKLDSKELVDMLAKAGITGKGSALASLTDEEEVKFREHLAKKAAKAGGGVAAVERPLERLEKPSVSGERVIKDLTKPKPAPLGKKVAKPKIAEGTEGDPAESSENGSSAQAPEKKPVGKSPLEKAKNVEEPVEASAATKSREAVHPVRSSPLAGRVGQRHGSEPAGERIGTPIRNSPGTSNPIPTTTGPLRRDDYIPPGGVARGKQTTPGGKTNDEGAGREGGKRKTNEPSKPSIRLAPMKFAPQTPQGKSGKGEPAPQKPDMRLPMDVIRSSKAGGAKPLEQHMKRTEAKQDVGGVKPRGRVPGATDTAASKEPHKDRKRVGGVKAPGEKEDLSMGGREARQLNRKRVGVKGKEDEDEPSPINKIRQIQRNKIRRTGSSGSTAAPRKSKVVLQLPCSVREFSEAAGVSAAQVLGKLMGMGIMTNITGMMDEEIAEMLAVELGVELDMQQQLDVEEEFLARVDSPDDEESMKPRPPVVTFLGHVDHGKTSLLDKIIGINVASGESGGITQHIRAYQVNRDGRKISFVDTPGHEAFTEMRARGANVTDIAVLVVAADDGVMPQTEEAINHARAAEVPIVVALNKIDLPGVDEQKIFSQLATAGLLPTEWGGEVEVVRTSATKGTGIDDLLETLFTIAELHELKANPDRLAVGTCLEAEVHGDRGVIAKFMVQRGTLRVGDPIVCGSTSGFVKAMFDTLAPFKKIDEAGPSTPVHITGLDMPPSAGQHFYAVEDISLARDIANKHQIHERESSIGGRGPSHVTLENLLERIGKEQAKNLNVILRADTRGSIEAILQELTKLDHPEVKVKVLQASVGGISEADIHLGDASDAVVIGFNVVPDDKARVLAEQRNVQVRRYDIIYKLTADLKAALEGLLKPEEREMELGRALVQRTFTISRVGTIAGCRVLSGIIQRNARMRIIRDSRVIGDYALDTLKREKDDAREVREGMECGIKLAGFNDIKEGDVLEAYKIEEIARTL